MDRTRQDQSTTSARREFRVDSLAPPISHYTDAVSWGGLLFVSGCAPLDGDGGLVGQGDAARQARQVMRNMTAVLAAAGYSIKDVVKVTVYLTDIADRALVNGVREEFFGSSRPASTLVEVSGLAVEGMTVEMDAIAGKP